MKHVRVTNANIEPVFFAYPDNNGLNAIVDKITAGEPEYDFVSVDGVGHHFWLVPDDEDIQRITDLFADIPEMYIADGHHRSAAAALVGAEKQETTSITGGEMRSITTLWRFVFQITS